MATEMLKEGVEVTHLDPEPIIRLLRTAVEELERGRAKYVSGGITVSLIDKDYVSVESNLVLQRVRKW